MPTTRISDAQEDRRDARRKNLDVDESRKGQGLELSSEDGLFCGERKGGSARQRCYLNSLFT
jgi:hypothetical protein